MNFFGESSEDLKSGIVGLNARLRLSNLPLSPEMREFLTPFESTCGHEKAYDLGVLSKARYPLGVYVSCHCHTNGKKLTLVDLFIGRKRNASPPKTLTKTSKKLGGYPNGFDRFLEFFGSSKFSCDATFFGMVPDTRRWPLKIKRNTQLKNIGKFYVDDEEINLENKNNGSRCSISFKPGKKEYMLRINSAVDIELNGSCFDSATEQLFEKVRPIFAIK